jgi:hypothetical protein
MIGERKKRRTPAHRRITKDFDPCLDRKKLDGRGNTSGKQWLVRQATIPVNQSLGRIFRHKRDFGTIIIIDMRYSEHKSDNLQSTLPKWIGKVTTTVSKRQLAMKRQPNNTDNLYSIRTQKLRWRK